MVGLFCQILRPLLTPARTSEAKKAQQEQNQWSKKVKKAILEGDWAEVEKFCNKSSIKSMKTFLYNVYKQQYLELVDRQEHTFYRKRTHSIRREHIL